MPLTDLELLRRHEPIVRFNEGEYFLPASVESYVAACELWERIGSSRRMVAEAGTLDLDRLVELTSGAVAHHYLRLVSGQIPGSELVAWRISRDRPRFRAETRLGRVGVFARFLDAGARLSLLARGRTPAGAQATAALLDRARPDAGTHPYYGRVVRDAGFVILQYWFFSFFNDWRSRAHGVNDHEGDWEQVTIYLVDDGDDHGPVPHWVAFSAHDEVGPDLRRRWDDPDLTVVDGHPVVHAGLGSHAGAYLAGEYLITVRRSRFQRVWRLIRRLRRFVQPWTTDGTDADTIGIPYVEYQRGDGVSIGPGQDRPWTPVVVDDDTTWIRGYTGLWGDDTNDPFGGERGPAGPRYERSGRVRRSWGDPVGWAGLDRVVPGDRERDRIVAARIEEIDAELDEIRRERERERQRLRAAVLGGAPDISDEERRLTELAARAVLRHDERGHLTELQRDGEPEVHPHAHLSRRHVPLEVDTGTRRRVLRIWATISTPLMLLLAAALVVPSDQSNIAIAGVGLLAVFAVEALARRRFLAFALGVASLAAIVAATIAVVRALVSSWQWTLAAVFVALAIGFLVLNLREIRRT